MVIGEADGAEVNLIKKILEEILLTKLDHLRGLKEKIF
jgi:hypothetical protein